jgi:cyclic beta-1,2-glucan synthetase
MRSELLDEDGMRAHARSLAGRQVEMLKGNSIPHSRRLEANERALSDVKEVLSAAIRLQQTAEPVVEWLLDNFYIIETQLRKAKQRSARDLLVGLPVPASGPDNKWPRLYKIIADFVSHSDGQVDMSMLAGYINAYQEVVCLQLKELRALPCILRLVLLENVRRIAVAIALVSLRGNRAELQEETKKEMRLLRISLKNNINSLRNTGSADWRDFMQEASPVDNILSADSSGVYERMDFYSRDAYCRIVEEISRDSKLSEPDLARLTVELTRKNILRGGEDQMSHVGFYLRGEGRPQLEELAGIRLKTVERVRRLVSKYHLPGYLFAVAFLCLPPAAWLLPQMEKDGVRLQWQIIAGVALVICLSHASIVLVNWLCTGLARPVLLPRLDFSGGIPQEGRTLVVVPSMLTSPAEVETLVNALEVRYLANRDTRLHFGLLTDFCDATEETLAGDRELRELARDKIAALNSKYHSESTFFLFHRPRLWNPREGLWMGYERKRGKLTQLNILLTMGDRRPFSIIQGDLSILTKIKYVITLDADTELPRDSAWKLIGTMMHPLNRAVYDAAKGRITKGYGILQPRIGIRIPEAARSLYIRMQGNDGEIDQYTRATADLYQDLFCESSFTGKGIYDVALFARTLTDRFPENSILSHDLIEGCYMRAGLVSDIQFYEQLPAGYYADTQRHHRWIRGDWQIWRYIFKPGLSALSRWKIFDNLRRSLVPVAYFLLLLLGWTVLYNPVFYTAAVVLIIVFPSLIALLLNLFKEPVRLLNYRHWWNAVSGVADPVIQSAYAIACLPYEAFYTSDAIVRTIWRMGVTKKHLLEWNYSANKVHQKVWNLKDTYRIMWICPVIASAVMLIPPVMLHEAFPAAWVLPVMWLASPAIAWWVSLPPVFSRTKLRPEQEAFLRKTARKMWSFFETLVGPSDNWLPPDYYQQYPIKRLSHRTSPTNMGLSLLANLAACDFGYLSTGEFLARTANTLQSMQLLDRDHGHFYNWYDTHTLKPVKPLYISTVDSGNLVGHLMVLRQGILSIPEERIAGPTLFRGLQDTLLLCGETATPFGEVLDASIQSCPGTLAGIRSAVGRLAALAKERLSALTDAAPGGNASRWAEALYRQCRSAEDELDSLAPWLSLPPAPGRCGQRTDLPDIPTLRQLAQLESTMLPEIDRLVSSGVTPEEAGWLDRLVKSLRVSGDTARARLTSVETLARQCMEFSDIEYDFLYDRQQQLLSIGYSVEKRRRDVGNYDLLASEARLAVFTGIAQGKIPQESWFALGRPLAIAGNTQVLLSWSGSMFEYLMPTLIMPAYKNTLLEVAGKAAVKKQISYAGKKGIPWGISESAYCQLDSNLIYQYGPFGVPELAMQRDADKNIVIAPYASLLSLTVAPREAALNLLELSRKGWEGEFGFFEAVDLTVSRLPNGKSCEVVRTFMMHHQSMGFLALVHYLLDQPMQRRFEAEPVFKTSLGLLRERFARETAFALQSPAGRKAPKSLPAGQHPGGNDKQACPEKKILPGSPLPDVQLLSNGRYQVMVTETGTGYSRWNDISLTRWRPDNTGDKAGLHCFIRDVSTGVAAPVTFQPVNQMDLATDMDIAVSAEDDVEIRRVRIKNIDGKRRIIEVTSYAEVVLAPAPDEQRHRALSNLFVKTEISPAQQAIFCTCDPRVAQKQMPRMYHAMRAYGTQDTSFSYETDRLKFIGRGNTLADAREMRAGGPLSNSDGAVLDPVVSIRCRIALEPGETVFLYLALGIGEKKESCEKLIAKYSDRVVADSVFTGLDASDKALLAKLMASEEDLWLYRQCTALMIYGREWQPSDRERDKTTEKTGAGRNAGRSGLWRHSISGDLPIGLLTVKDLASLELVEQLVRIYSLWLVKGLAVDLVIINDNQGNYRQFFHAQLTDAAAAGLRYASTDRAGRIYVLEGGQLSAEDRSLLLQNARIVIGDGNGTLAEQLHRYSTPADLPPPHQPVLAYVPERAAALSLPALLFYNGIGGFAKDGREYILASGPERSSPMPWANILANAHFGTMISESGQSYTWTENAHECRLSPWNNDPVCDFSGEAFFLRDEEDGHYWSPTPLPARANTTYITRHGFGYSIFECREHGIHSEMRVYVDPDRAVKYTVLTLSNHSDRKRGISVTGYVEWVLGDLRTNQAAHIIATSDPSTGTLIATNRNHPDFAGKVCFFSVAGAGCAGHTFTTDRTEFIGREGSLSRPAAMGRSALSGRTGAPDPCAALQVMIGLEPGEECETVFFLGCTGSVAEAGGVAGQRNGTAGDAFDRLQRHWRRILGVIEIDTPDPALNLLTNGWLVYQTIASRLWGRTGYYQSGGAFGFRDQLQDVLALIPIAPHITRQQILLCASRQFEDGDVLHWWHPPLCRGIRTRCSDDLLWLPFVTCRYVTGTDDAGILDEPVYFLEGGRLSAGEESYYGLFEQSVMASDLYDHCVRAIRRSLTFGEHGLPLIGSGDWNDAMNKVGKEGRGESVWVGFFLYDVLIQFAGLAGMRGDRAFAVYCKSHATELQEHIERNGWDGAWYRRAYFDNGEPLGSSDNDECQIDSICQSWSLLSGAASRKRSGAAMEAAYVRLVDREHALIRLLDPPFRDSHPDPGYIKGYPSGIRENGGQYTHAAIWMIMAFAKLKDTRRAWELLRFINPIYHSDTPERASVYKVEPYVVAADVYSAPEHRGRGGWTWYTGAAGWYYQLVIHSFLGLAREGNLLRFSPCLPEEWNSVKVVYRNKETVYHITIVNREDTPISVFTHPSRRRGNSIILVEDGREHRVTIFADTDRSREKIQATLVNESE